MERVPILIADGCELPLEEEIDWDSLILRVDEADIGNIGSILEEFSSHLSPLEWIYTQDFSVEATLRRRIRVA